MSKDVLIVVDMQNDFIDGSLGTKEAVSIVPNVRKKIQGYVDRGDAVIFTRDTHYSDYLETHEGKCLPVVHCIEQTPGWQVASEADIPSCMHIDKTTFGYLGWGYRIGTDVSKIEIVGLCTDICVVSNALILRAMYPEIDIVVDASCCAGVTPETHQAALTTMKMCQIKVIGE